MWNPILLDTSSFSFQKHVSGVFLQVRNATKRAAGSRTSMKDSAGRRLGPKKYEGQDVSTGEIIMRQRGTKFYPGEGWYRERSFHIRLRTWCCSLLS